MKLGIRALTKPFTIQNLSKRRFVFICVTSLSVFICIVANSVDKTEHLFLLPLTQYHSFLTNQPSYPLVFFFHGRFIDSGFQTSFQVFMRCSPVVYGGVSISPKPNTRKGKHGKEQRNGLLYFLI